LRLALEAMRAGLPARECGDDVAVAAFLEGGLKFWGAEVYFLVLRTDCEYEVWVEWNMWWRREQEARRLREEVGRLARRARGVFRMASFYSFNEVGFANFGAGDWCFLGNQAKDNA